MTVKPSWARKRDRLRRREADAPLVEMEEPLWPWSIADWRLLVITFAGGLGSIVAAAGVIGGAIAIARQVSNEGLRIWAAIAAAWLLALVVVLRALGRAAFRAADEGSDRGLLAVRVLLIAFAVWGVAAVITLLVWIGVAAGIH